VIALLLSLLSLLLPIEQNNNNNKRIFFFPKRKKNREKKMTLHVNKHLCDVWSCGEPHSWYRNRSLCSEGADCGNIPADPLNPRCGECPWVHPPLPAFFCKYGIQCRNFRCAYRHPYGRLPDCEYITVGNCMRQRRGQLSPCVLRHLPQGINPRLFRPMRSVADFKGQPVASFRCACPLMAGPFKLFLSSELSGCWTCGAVCKWCQGNHLSLSHFRAVHFKWRTPPVRKPFSIGFSLGVVTATTSPMQEIASIPLDSLEEFPVLSKPNANIRKQQQQQPRKGTTTTESSY
jgi:hypothetical protein